MCLCPNWRQTSQSSDTLKSPQQVCVSFRVCVYVFPHCHGWSCTQWGKVLSCWQSCPLHVERSEQKECSGPSCPSLIRRYCTVISVHAFYLALALIARVGLTIPSLTDVFKQTSGKGRGTYDMWFGGHIRAGSCDIRSMILYSCFVDFEIFLIQWRSFKDKTNE